MKKQIIKVIDSAKKKWQLIVYVVIIDLLLMLGYGFVVPAIFQKILEYMTYMSAEFSNVTPNLIRDYATSPSLFEIIGSSPELASAFKSMLLMFGLVILSVYILYSLFQGLSWKLAGEIVGEKISYYEYCKRFAVVNIFWGVLFVLYEAVGFFNDFNQLTATRMNSEYAGISGLLFVFLLLLIYFMFISYALILDIGAWKAFKRSFVVGVRKAGYFIPRGFVIFAGVYIIDKLLVVASFSKLAMLGVGVILLLPFVALSRAYVFEMVKEANI